MINFKISIGLPGYLDAEDDLSNLLQDEGTEKDLACNIETAIQDWIIFWEPNLRHREIKVKVEQE